MWVRCVYVIIKFYVGYWVYDGDKSLLFGNGGSYGYFIVISAKLGVDGQWYEGYIIGEGTVMYFFFVGICFIKLLIIVNYVNLDVIDTSVI